MSKDLVVAGAVGAGILALLLWQIEVRHPSVSDPLTVNPLRDNTQPRWKRLL